MENKFKKIPCSHFGTLPDHFLSDLHFLFASPTNLYFKLQEYVTVEPYVMVLYINDPFGIGSGSPHTAPCKFISKVLWEKVLNGEQAICW